MNEAEEQQLINFENTGRLVVSTLSYPIENAKTLIQIGHEPLKPFKTKTLFGNPILCLPNVFKYAQHIYSVDGLQGCYRGFIPWLSTNILYRYTQIKIQDSIPKGAVENKNEDELSADERQAVFCGVLTRGIASRAVAVVVTQPLHVITVRTIAQFVGRETKYSGIFSSLWTIVKEEGIFALFSGLIPRLLSDILVFTLATTGVYVIQEYIVHDPDSKRFINPLVQYIAAASLYSFTVVGNCMAVTNCGLAAGSPPNMPHYHHMFDCWSHLQGSQQLKRGSSILWRYYTPTSSSLLLGNH